MGRHVERRDARRQDERHDQDDGDHEIGARCSHQTAERRPEEAAQPAAAAHRGLAARDETRGGRDAPDEQHRPAQPRTAQVVAVAAQQRDRDEAEVHREEVRRDAHRAQDGVGQKMPDRAAEVLAGQIG